MEKEFDARALLRNGDAFVFSENRSKAYQLLLETDPLDPILQDRLDAVLEERGIELYTPEYDKEIGPLQNKYLLERNGFVSVEELSFAQGRGKPCGASHISASYTCRVGSSLDFTKANEKERERLEEKYQVFKSAIAGYSPEAQKVFEREVKTSIDELNGEGRTAMTDAKIVKSYDRVLTNATILAKDGPPTSIVDKAGNQVEVSDKLQPTLSRQGGMAWKDPATNTSYTKRSAGQMELTQNRQQLADDLKNGRVEAGIKHYQKWKKDPAAQAKGEFGSPQSAKLREPSQKEIDREWSKLSPSQKRLVATSGLDAVGGRIGGDGKMDPRTAHRKFFEDNPDQMERRGKDVLAGYLAQSPRPGAKAISPLTGKELDLPGTYGAGKSTVDHFKPLSSFYGKGDVSGPWTRDKGLQITLQADSVKNMVLVEAGLNQSKGKRENWDAITAGWQRQVDKQDKVMKRVEKLPSFTRTTNQSARSGRPRVTQRARQPVKVEKRSVAPKSKYSGWTKSRFERAIQRAYDQGDESKVAALRAAMARL